MLFVSTNLKVPVCNAENDILIHSGKTSSLLQSLLNETSAYFSRSSDSRIGSNSPEQDRRSQGGDSNVEFLDVGGLHRSEKRPILNNIHKPVM